MSAQFEPPQETARRGANRRVALILTAVALAIFALMIMDHWPRGH